MQSRRNVLLGAVAAGAVLGTGSLRAVALSSEPMAPEDLKALSLACSNLASHTQLVADARLLLDDEIKSGIKPANYLETVVCPFCHCAFQVSPDLGF